MYSADTCGSRYLWWLVWRCAISLHSRNYAFRVPILNHQTRQPFGMSSPGLSQRHLARMTATFVFTRRSDLSNFRTCSVCDHTMHHAVLFCAATIDKSRVTVTVCYCSCKLPEGKCGPIWQSSDGWPNVRDSLRPCLLHSKVFDVLLCYVKAVLLDMRVARTLLGENLLQGIPIGIPIGIPTIHKSLGFPLISLWWFLRWSQRTRRALGASSSSCSSCCFSEPSRPVAWCFCCCFILFKFIKYNMLYNVVI